MTKREDERAELLNRLSHALCEDRRIAGVVLVGSGAIGFRDEYSDVDLVAPVLAAYDAAAVFRDWKRRAVDVLDVRHDAATAFTEQQHLLVLLCAGGLEIDLSFPTLTSLVATIPSWQVLWERSDDLTGRMMVPSPSQPLSEQAYAWLVNRAIHRAVYATKALRRGQVWKALMLIDELRSRVIHLVGCASLGSFYDDVLGTDGIERHVDDLPADVLVELAKTLPAQIDVPALRASLDACLHLIFQAMLVLDRRYSIERSVALSVALREHLGVTNEQ